MSEHRNLPDGNPDRPAPSLLQKVAVSAIMVVAGLYLLNPGAGVIDLIPDVIPVLGNLDEASAVAILISGLNYFGVNTGWLTGIFGPGMRKAKRKREERE